MKLIDQQDREVGAPKEIHILVVSILKGTTSFTIAALILAAINLLVSSADIRHDGLLGRALLPLPATTPRVGVRPTRILVGIMTMDAPHELECRRQFRELFGLFDAHHDGRVCSLGSFIANPSHHEDCQLVYTFVMGANPDGPTELVNNSMPVVRTFESAKVNASDKHFNDMTLLNIRENMEEGKSQTWLFRAQQLVADYHFDYVAKSDSDSLLDVPKLLDFVDQYLPPAPYNKAILAGKPCDKLWWGNWRTSPLDYPHEEQEAKESYLRERYRFLPRHNTPFHPYAIGQFYLLSPDLVDTVVQEASSEKHKGYMEGAEDHDISAMAFRSTRPIHFIFLSETDMQFWEHDVKLTPDSKRVRRSWRRKWNRAKQELDDALSKS